MFEDKKDDVDPHSLKILSKMAFKTIINDEDGIRFFHFML